MTGLSPSEKAIWVLGSFCCCCSCVFKLLVFAQHQRINVKNKASCPWYFHSIDNEITKFLKMLARDSLTVILGFCTGFLDSNEFKHFQKAFQILNCLSETTIFCYHLVLTGPWLPGIGLARGTRIGKHTSCNNRFTSSCNSILKLH